MNILNRQIRLAARPHEIPKPNDWTLSSEKIRELKEGEILIKIEYVSIDPVMRLWMNEGLEESVHLGDVMKAFAAGHVLNSKSSEFIKGESVVGYLGVQEYAIAKASDLLKVDTKIASLSMFLGILGLTGLTAYFGLFEVGKPKSSDVVVISAAAGAVGSVVGQLAKMQGCHVVGIAGGETKCRFLVEKLGFDAAIDHKQANVAAGLKHYCPKGINLYFDNVGGEILDAVLEQIIFKSRIVICGAISQYNFDRIKGPSNYLSLLFNHGRMEGFTVYDYENQFPDAMKEMANWVKQKKLINVETIAEGLDTFPETFLKLFKGENLGKLLLKV